MMGNRALLMNFVKKFIGTVRFGNNDFAVIAGYGDVVIGSMTIKKVYYVEGLRHNLFSVGQFCDNGLEVAFQKSTCFVQNDDGVDLLIGDRSSNLYTIALNEVASNSSTCLLAKASSLQSWLWHQRLSHLNFTTINNLTKNNLVQGLPKMKFKKDHLCSAWEQGKINRKHHKSKTAFASIKPLYLLHMDLKPPMLGEIHALSKPVTSNSILTPQEAKVVKNDKQGKSKRASHLPKPVPNSRQRLHLLHMDLCGPMRIASINGKRYVLVIMDDYSCYTWVHFLRSKDEAPKVIKTFLKRIIVLLQSPVIIIRTDNGTEFKNQALKEYFDNVGISHQMSSIRTPQQNGVVERRNWTLVEAARTVLIFSRAPLFLWAEAIATACFTQNRSIIHRRFNKTPYQLINGRKSDISFLHVFEALCYPNNDREDIGKLGAKGDIGFFIGYSADSCASESMGFEQRSSKPGLQSMTSRQISLGLDLTYALSTITTQQPTEDELDLLFKAMYDDYIGGQPSATQRTVLAVQAQ
nr:retrovirus-related Pol polyprotein from transposon TNT 1-94 [Tanacetum cinerariifolium]